MATAKLSTARQHFYALAARQVIMILEMRDQIARDPNLLVSRNLSSGVLELLEYYICSRNEIMEDFNGSGIPVPKLLRTGSSMKEVQKKMLKIDNSFHFMYFLELLLELRIWVLHPVYPFPMEGRNINALWRFCEAVEEVENSLK